ncbi:MAG TPA: aminotransferase class V-fold PLP-dependent enzyme [Terriglobia bacterium]|nr:aminotransferase class V-fold PLP-dependent enzyme [Terriglobia bacterium]
MGKAAQHTKSDRRRAPIEMSPEEFRAAGHRLVDRIAEFLDSIPKRPVTPAETPQKVRRALGDGPVPERGVDAQRLLEEAAELLAEHSLLSGHPRFWGYIYSSAAPIGALADFLAAAVNPNSGAWNLSPIATEIEAQTVRWIAELIGYPADCGGLLVSGGNMANFVPFLVARKAKADWDVRSRGLRAMDGPPSGGLRVYCSAETHTWIQKACDLFGLGTEAIRWIPTDDELRMDLAALEKQIGEDRRNGDFPFLLIGAAGSVSTGAVDPLPRLAEIARQQNLWFHVDGAYGALAAALPDASTDLRGLALADSVAVDPHKWMYAPVEAGCALVRDRKMLPATFSYRPPYYHFAESEEMINYFEYGLQNSRGFRALKVWLALRQVGREGYVQMIADDIRLAEALYHEAEAHPELEAVTQGLSITTFRYVPRGLKPGSNPVEEYLNRLNEELLTRLQQGGETFVTNAVIRGKFVLRACIVNFRTSMEDVQAVPEIIARVGREVDKEIRPENL